MTIPRLSFGRRVACPCGVCTVTPPFLCACSQDNADNSPTVRPDDPMGRILMKPDTGEPAPRYQQLLRHFAIVVDGKAENVAVYSDGAKVGSRNVSRQDICAADNPSYHAERLGLTPKTGAKAELKTVLLLGARDESRPPESSVSPEKPLELQQFRIYHGKALTESEVKLLHESSVNQDGTLLKQCAAVDSGERDVLGWSDLLGHDCAWYGMHRATFPFICSGSEVSTNCKVACANQQCFSSKLVDEYYLGSQIQMFTEDTTMCVSSNVSDERGLPVMNEALFRNTVCANAEGEAADAAIAGRGQRSAGSEWLNMSSGILGSLGWKFGTTFIASERTKTIWPIAPKVGGNVTLVITAMDVDANSVVKVLPSARRVHRSARRPRCACRLTR